MESWPEIKCAIIERRFPNLIVTGGIIVTVGVLTEVVLGIFITQRADRIQSEADEQVANALERAATAEKIAAEANLARVKIEQRLSARVIPNPEYAELKQLLLSHAGKLLDIVMFDHHVIETGLFANQIFRIFFSAGWKCRIWESRAATTRIAGPSMVIAIADGNENEYIDLANAIARIMYGLELDCEVRLGSFGFAGGKEFKQGDFVLTLEQPRQFMGTRFLSPFRIQIGEKQVATLPSRRTVVVGPVTPPQA